VLFILISCTLEDDSDINGSSGLSLGFDLSGCTAVRERCHGLTVRAGRLLFA